ncbi:MAG: PAS domain-containing sensor histidine kinase, partial [Cyanobacteria bacterium J06635_13]
MSEIVDLIPVVDHQEYIVCDRNLVIVKFSEHADKYTIQKITVGQEVSVCIPEMVGLETTCQEILAQQQDSFALES